MKIEDKCSNGYKNVVRLVCGNEENKVSLVMDVHVSLSDYLEAHGNTFELNVTDLIAEKHEYVMHCFVVDKTNNLALLSAHGLLTSIQFNDISKWNFSKNFSDLVVDKDYYIVINV